ncbi:UNVERIFIED_CONTAM: hypothetical protein K2H54_013239, partial [Gekko kuhli]
RFLVADERLPKFSRTVSEVTVMNLLPNKKATLILTVEKTGKGLRSPSFHHSAPNLSEMTKEEAPIRAEKVLREGAPSPKTFYATEAQSMENLVPNRSGKLVPLESCLEAKEAQLQKIMSFKRDAQLTASKLASVGSVSSEPHVKRVKNLPQVDVENRHKIKMAEKATLEHQDQNSSSKVTKPTCEVQIILPTEGEPKTPKNPKTSGSPIPCHKPTISQNFQGPDSQETAKMVDSSSPGNGQHRFRLKQMKEQESLGQAKPVETTGYEAEEGKQKLVHQRAQKTLSNASKLLENIAQKHRGREEELDEIDKELLMRIQASRRMALGDITQVDED